MVFSELGDSQGSFSYITPSSDLDIDDATLGKLLTEAHREHADYRSPEGVSVSQSSLSVVFDRTGKPVGESNLDQFCFGVRNAYSAHSKFSENTQAEKMVDGSGKPVERDSSNAQIRTLLDEQRQAIIAEYCEKISHHELQAKLEPKKNAEFYKKNYGVSKRIFVKFINKVLLRWRSTKHDHDFLCSCLSVGVPSMFSLDVAFVHHFNQVCLILCISCHPSQHHVRSVGVLTMDRREFPLLLH